MSQSNNTFKRIRRENFEIPEELLFSITSFLPIFDIFTLISLVSKSFYKFYNKPDFYKDIIKIQKLFIPLYLPDEWWLSREMFLSKIYFPIKRVKKYSQILLEKAQELSFVDIEVSPPNEDELKLFLKNHFEKKLVIPPDVQQWFSTGINFGRDEMIHLGNINNVRLDYNDYLKKSLQSYQKSSRIKFRGSYSNYGDRLEFLIDNVIHFCDCDNGTDGHTEIDIIANIEMESFGQIYVTSASEALGVFKGHFHDLLKETCDTFVMYEGEYDQWYVVWDNCK